MLLRVRGRKDPIPFGPFLAIGGATALFWGGRALVLPWLGVRPSLTTSWLKAGYYLLLTECVAYAVAYGYLALRHP